MELLSRGSEAFKIEKYRPAVCTFGGFLVQYKWNQVAASTPSVKPQISEQRER